MAAMLAGSHIAQGFHRPKHEVRGDGGKKMIRRIKRRKEQRLLNRELREFLVR